jgi:predicted dehydrogenase
MYPGPTPAAMPISLGNQRAICSTVLMTEAVRWGVLGTAGIAVRKVIPAMIGSELSHVVGIASRNVDRAGEVAAQFSIPRSFGSYEELLDDPEIEAVYIPLPNHMHAEWTLRAAAAGKHVLCEKPLAITAAEAMEMVEGCARAGVKLMEAFMYRLHPLWERTRQLVSDGHIGELLAIQAFFSYRNVDATNIRNIPEYGGGALMDVGCYPINVARMMFGSEPEGVKASIVRHPDFGTDVLTSAVLDFGGRQASFMCSTILESDQRVHLMGTDGRLVVEIPFNIPPDRPTRVVRYAGGQPPADPGVEVFEVPAADQYRLQADAFSRAIRIDREVPTPPADAVGNMTVIEQVLAAAR